ncbi:nuclear transport factor 2 family protein [Actinomycetospora sp. OC33-EN08]|uniref:Nuclear transport factor 2 family protein n=1 Tax=Actinomycetospora aurantiaca TaxID=3129233 RepID=A0ABU8MV29_9PSEU
MKVAPEAARPRPGAPNLSSRRRTWCRQPPAHAVRPSCGRPARRREAPSSNLAAPHRGGALTPAATAAGSPAHAVLLRSIELLAAMDLDGYIDLFADDAVIEFPYAPPGRPARLDTPSAVRDYVTAIGAAVTIESFPSLVVHHLADPHSIVAEVALHGTAVETGAPYDVQYVWILEERDGRIVRFRDYWNPTHTTAATGSADGGGAE